MGDSSWRCWLGYNDNNTIEDVQDDKDKVVNSSLGNGNLPSTSVYSLAKDRDGEVWVGTNKGILCFTVLKMYFLEMILMRNKF